MLTIQLLILDGSEKSLSEALRVLESFEKVSGLRLNGKKTEGSLDRFLVPAKAKNCTLRKISTGKIQKLKCSEFGYQPTREITTKLNFSEKIEKMRNCLGCWSVRRLSLIGKITVLKSLIASPVSHLLSPPSSKLSNYKTSK